jgi:Protein of unknown function (DUF2752)
MASRSFRVWLSSSLALAAGWIVYRFPPATTPWYPQCVFHTLTGLDCPGCGGTRAVHQLLHGNLADAFALNPLVFLYLLPVAVLAAPAILRGENPRFMSRPWFGWTSVVVVTGFWIGRNLV